MGSTVLQPESIDSNATSSGRWMVVIYNNAHNSMDEVVSILMVATACTLDEAYTEMWEAHHYGKAPVHFASRPECETAAAIIASIGVKTAVAPEWED